MISVVAFMNFGDVFVYAFFLYIVIYILGVMAIVMKNSINEKFREFFIMMFLFPIIDICIFLILGLSYGPQPLIRSNECVLIGIFVLNLLIGIFAKYLKIQWLIRHRRVFFYIDILIIADFAVIYILKLLSYLLLTGRN